MDINEVKNALFYQFPQWLLEEPYNKLSHRAMLVYMLLFDRRGLSEENGWFDKDGRIYIYFTNQQFMEVLKCSEKTVISAKNELHKFDLLDEVRQGRNKPNRLYLNGVKKRRVRNCKKYSSGAEKNTVLELENLQPINTNIINTNNINNINREANPLKKIVDLIRENWGKDLTPIELETVTHMLADYPFEMIEYGIREATLRNKKTIRWVDSACKDWYVNQNLETVVAVQDYLNRPIKNVHTRATAQSNVPTWSQAPVKTEQTVEGQANLRELYAELEEMEKGGK